MCCYGSNSFIEDCSGLLQLLDYVTSVVMRMVCNA